MPTVLDHVLVAVADLDREIERWRTLFGLGALPMGTHPSGTSNAAVPLGGTSYIELISAPVTATTERATKVRGLCANGSRLFSWCVAVEDVVAAAARCGLASERGAVTLEDGTKHEWNVAGVDNAWSDPSVPFFIDYGYDRAELWRARLQAAHHDRMPDGFANLAVPAGDHPLADWLATDPASIGIAVDVRATELGCSIRLADGSELVVP